MSGSDFEDDIYLPMPARKSLAEIEASMWDLDRTAKAYSYNDEVEEYYNRHISVLWDELKSERRKAGLLAKIQTPDDNAQRELKEFGRRVEALAKGIRQIAQAAIVISVAAESGDPYAISGSVLDLAGSLVSTVGAISGPPGAAAGALLGAILGAVSAILKQFVPQPPSLIKQLEDVIRKIRAEEKLEELKAAFEATNGLDVIARSGKKYSYDQVIALYNPIGGVTMNGLGEARQWLVQPNNRELALWSDVLAATCQTMITLKLALAHFLPNIDDKPGGDGVAKLVDAFNALDQARLEFIENIKEPARNRGIICHIGNSGIFVRDIVDAETADWHDVTGSGGALGISYRNEATPSRHPYLSLFHLGGQGKADWLSRNFDVDANPRDARQNDFERLRQLFPAGSAERARVEGAIEAAALHPFIKWSRAYDMDGSAPLATGNHSKWQELKELKDCYDICAIRGDGPLEINVFTAAGDRINGYVENRKGEHLNARTWTTEPVDGYKVGAVRAVRPRKREEPAGKTAFQSGRQGPDGPEVLRDVDWVVYGLCEVRAGKSKIHQTAGDRFEIQAFFGKTVRNESAPGTYQMLPVRQGLIVPPSTATETGKLAANPYYGVGHETPIWRSAPVGIAADSERIFVFGKWWIACATHAVVRGCLERNNPMPVWTTYVIPSEVGGYDPRKRAFQGLCDLAACDDGTLTAVFEDKDGIRRIFTATTCFEPDQVIKAGRQNDHRGNPKPTHGWTEADPHRSRRIIARRVQKQPIFCWPMIEALEVALNPDRGYMAQTGTVATVENVIFDAIAGAHH